MPTERRGWAWRKTRACRAPWSRSTTPAARSRPWLADAISISPSSTAPPRHWLTDQEARSAYDRLAASKFQDHDCSVHGEPAVLVDSESFAARARKLVTRGFKP